MLKIFPRPLPVAALLLAAALGGCATGQIGQTPPVSRPRDAANVTIFRDGSWVGLGAPILLRIDGCKAFRIGPNQSYSFRLDPGEYTFDYSIGLNECRRVAIVEPGGSYRFRLAPNCARFDWGC